MSIITGLSINYEVELVEELLIQSRLSESVNVYTIKPGHEIISYSPYL